MDKNIKVLIVDDILTMRRVVKRFLLDIGFSNIDDAEDGKDALKRLRHQDYDLVISDWNMPNMSGIELLKAIRADENFSKIPVLLVTAEARKEQIIEAAKAGVSGYIIKPFNSDTLKQKLSGILDPQS